MKSKNKLIGFGYLVFILLSCVPETSISTDNITVKPTAVTSNIPVMITSNSSSLPVVSTSSPMDQNLSKYEKYYNNVYCTLADENPIAKLDSPVDLSVTQDGKTIYVINNIKSHVDGSIKFIDRSYIYKVTDNKKISVIKTQEGYSYGCELSGGIEIDKDKNIYTSYPVYEDLKITDEGHNGTLPFIKEHKIVKIANETDLSIIGDIKIPYPGDVSQTRNPIIHPLANIYVSKKDSSIYFNILDIKSYYSISSIKKMSKPYSEIETIVDSDPFNLFGLDLYIVENNKVYIYGYNFIDLNSSDKKPQPLIPIDGIKTAPTQIKMNSKGEIIASFSKLYDEVPIKHKIMKIVPGKGVFNFAGNGNAGFKDGKGEEAEFNNPIGLDIDAQDNIYVADTGNNAIRKITPDGEVTTFYKEGN